MQKIIHASAHNFMTFEDVEFTLEEKAYIIKGENKDDAGQQSNGSGKTSLMDIIAVTLLGESLTGRDIKDCVNWIGDDPYFITSVTLNNGVDTVIKRKIYNNTKSAELSITVNGEPIKGVPTKTGVVNGVDVKAGNQYILDNILGITKEDLLNYYLISGDYQSFFSCGNAKKIEIINRFSKAQVVDKSIDKLTTDVKEGKNEILNIQTKIATAEGHIKGLEESINETAINDFHNKKNEKLKHLMQSIEQIENDINEITLFDIKPRDWTKIFEEDEAEIKDVSLLLSDFAIQERVLEKDIARINNKLAGEIVCPECDHHFILDNSANVDELKSKLSELTEELQVLLADITETRMIKKSLEDAFELIKKERNTERQMIQENEFNTKRKVKLQADLECTCDEIEKLEELKFDDSSVISKIGDKKTLIDVLDLDLDMATGQVNMATEWIENFKQFKFYLANKPIEIICHYTNEFLKNLDSDLSITIEGFKVLKSGELRAELTPIVYRNGMNGKPYTSFSEGEKVRLNIAVDLALQKLVNENSNEGLSFYSNDECLSALDSVGISNIAKALNLLNQLVLIVTHSGSDLGNIENLIVVEKSEGISSIRI